MCRNIKTLFNFTPPATELEIRDASLQFVRKLSGFSVPSQANAAAFEQAVDEVAHSARRLIAALVTRRLSGLGSGLRRGEFRCQLRRRRGVGLPPTTSRQRRLTPKIVPALRVEAGNGLIRRCQCAPCRQAWLCLAPRLSPLPASSQARPQARQPPSAEPRLREVEAAKARARSLARFGGQGGQGGQGQLPLP